MSDFYDDDALSAASTVEAFGDNDDALSAASTIEAFGDNDDELINEEDIFYAIYLYINNL